MEKENNLISAVNFYITKACNMRCKYCFAGFKQVKSYLNVEEQKKIIKMLYYSGFSKLNLVGGEPFLVDTFSELIKYSKQLGFYTSIVTNGTLLTTKFLKENARYIDQIGLSIDSLNAKTNEMIGRIYENIIPDRLFYEKMCNRILSSGIDLKINTVVSKFNRHEVLSDFILSAKPIRWKVLQVLSVDGENDIEKMKISDNEFQDFIVRNSKAKNVMIYEKSEIIRGSYIMIDPMGRFFDNTNDRYTISEPINKVGVEKALEQISFSNQKFIKRKGDYYKHLTSKKIAS